MAGNGYSRMNQTISDDDTLLDLLGTPFNIACEKNLKDLSQNFKVETELNMDVWKYFLNPKKEEVQKLTYKDLR